MFRNFVITKLTQSSAWLGLAVIIGALFLPRTWELFVGLLLILNDDKKLEGLFQGWRAQLEKWWTP